MQSAESRKQISCILLIVRLFLLLSLMTYMFSLYHEHVFFFSMYRHCLGYSHLSPLNHLYVQMIFWLPNVLLFIQNQNSIFGKPPGICSSLKIILYGISQLIIECVSIQLFKVFGVQAPCFIFIYNSIDTRSTLQKALQEITGQIYRAYGVCVCAFCFVLFC